MQRTFPKKPFFKAETTTSARNLSNSRRKTSVSKRFPQKAGSDKGGDVANNFTSTDNKVDYSNTSPVDNLEVDAAYLNVSSLSNTATELASGETGLNDDMSSFREDIANMPLGRVKQLKERLGLPLFNKTFFGAASSTTKKRMLSSNVPKRKSSKHPREMSSKKPVSKYRNIYGNENINKMKYDPRFDERCGPFDEYIYKTNFSFLDKLRDEEKQILRREVSELEEQDPARAVRIKETLKKIADREKTEAEVERRREVIREVRRENNERMRQGFKPIFRTRAELRKRSLEKKFIELKRSNRLNKFMEKLAKRQQRKTPFFI